MCNQAYVTSLVNNLVMCTTYVIRQGINSEHNTIIGKYKGLHFKFLNNNNQYRLIFQSPPYQRLTSLIVHTRVRTLAELTRA